MRHDGKVERKTTAPQISTKRRGMMKKIKPAPLKKREKGGVNFGVILAKMEFKKKD